MTDFKIKTANDDVTTEIGKLYNEFRIIINEYRKAVAKISNSSDIKFIELAQDAKDKAHNKLNEIKEYKKNNNDMNIDEGERVIINVLGAVDDVFQRKLD